ncbi:MAG TPA: glycosyltransferase [Acetobacteraceae bacterium]|nr:glycosyltransferase [Acetobacteraceae bacterium]
MQIPVLAVNRVGFLGGVERLIVNGAVGVRERGFRTTLTCPAPGTLADAAAAQGIDVIPAPIDRSKATLSPRKWFLLRNALKVGSRAITGIARETGAALLHAHHPIGALYALDAARSLGLPLILHVHETLPLAPLYGLVARHVIPHCALLVCVSEAGRALTKRLGVPDARVRLIYNGVDRSFLAPPAPVPELARPGPHIGIFGVLEPRKGQEDFIHAATRLKERHPGAQFWIIGALSYADNGPYVKRLRKVAAEGGIADRVHFAGHRDNAADWMAGVDLVVLASRERESLPTVLIEAGILGRPMVATEVGGVREIVCDGQTGLVVPPSDPAALADAMHRILGPDGTVMAERARTDAHRRFTPERFADELAALYHFVLTQPRTAMENAA